EGLEPVLVGPEPVLVGPEAQARWARRRCRHPDLRALLPGRSPALRRARRALGEALLPPRRRSVCRVKPDPRRSARPVRVVQVGQVAWVGGAVQVAQVAWVDGARRVAQADLGALPPRCRRRPTTSKPRACSPRWVRRSQRSRRSSNETWRAFAPLA